MDEIIKAIEELPSHQRNALVVSLLSKKMVDYKAVSEGYVRLLEITSEHHQDLYRELGLEVAKTVLNDKPRENAAYMIRLCELLSKHGITNICLDAKKEEWANKTK